MLKLGTMVSDIATGIKGMLTHYVIDMSENENYVFQPHSLDLDGQPTKPVWLDEKRIKGAVKENINLPLEILGTNATDRATGYKGMIIMLTYHENGCVHGTLKAKGTNSQGSSIDTVDIDIRRLEGPAIKKMTEKQRKDSKIKKPSPSTKPLRKY